VDHHFAHSLLRRRKLALVLDIDHTLLHSVAVESLGWSAEEARARRGVHILGRGMTATILRPGVQAFFDAVKDAFEIHICTMGVKWYAEEVVCLLDPRREFIRHIVSREDHSVQNVKSLDVLLVEPTATLILDDTVNVWTPHDRKSVVHISPFIVPDFNRHESYQQNEAGLHRAACVLLATHTAFYRNYVDFSPPPDVREKLARVLRPPPPRSQPAEPEPEPEPSIDESSSSSESGEGEEGECNTDDFNDIHGV